MFLNIIKLSIKIRENDADAILIYISAYDNYFIELFEVEPFRFIKKPVDDYIFDAKTKSSSHIAIFIKVFSSFTVLLMLCLFSIIAYYPSFIYIKPYFFPIFS